MCVRGAHTCATYIVSQVIKKVSNVQNIEHDKKMPDGQSKAMYFERAKFPSGVRHAMCLASQDNMFKLCIVFQVVSLKLAQSPR